MIALVLSLTVVALGADALVRGASALARHAGLSPLFIGLTVVGFGTSTPELGASLSATLASSSDVAVGNVVGSNIFNVAVILGLTALFRPIRIRLDALRRDLLVAILAACLPWFALATGGALPRWLGIALLVALVAYIHGTYKASRRESDDQCTLAEAELQAVFSLRPRSDSLLERTWIAFLLVIGGLGLLTVGSRVFVNSALEIARQAGVSELFIGLTIVAAGTSVPELVTSIIAAIRRSPDIAVGNIVGSNIFNMLGILGLSATVAPQRVNALILWRDTPIMLVTTLALIPILRTGGVVSRWEGGLLLAGYALYVATMWRLG